MTNTPSRTIRVYHTYSFRNKDPVIDELRTIAQREARRQGMSFTAIQIKAAQEAGLSTSTPKGWFHGTTRRPQNPTIEAFGRAIGYKRKWVKE